MSAKCPICHIQSEKKMNKEQKSFWEYGAAWATQVKPRKSFPVGNTKGDNA